MSFNPGLGATLLRGYQIFVVGSAVVGAAAGTATFGYMTNKGCKDDSLPVKVACVTAASIFGGCAGFVAGGAGAAAFPIPVAVTINHYTDPANRAHTLEWVQSQVNSVRTKFQ